MSTQVFATHRPNLLIVLMFGWLFLLVRQAFAMQTERCRDCDAVRRYKTAGSWVALIALLLLVALVASALFSENGIGE